MLLAVNMPEQEPHVGQATCSISNSLASSIVPGGDRPHRLENRDQVHSLAVFQLAGIHRTAGNEDSGDVAAHGGHEHARHDLVTVGDADQGVKLVRLHHCLDAVGDDLTAGQAVFHAKVPHGDAIVHTDRVEDEGNAARLAHGLFDDFPEFIQMHMAGNDVDVAVGDSNEGLGKVLFFDAGGAQQTAMRRSFDAFFDDIGTEGTRRGG